MKGDFSNNVLIGLKAREEWAFDHIYSSNRAWLYTIAYKIIGEEADAQDVVQEFFTDLWGKQLYNNVESNLKGYLLQSIRNRALNYIKKRKFDKQIAKSLIHEVSYIVPSIKAERDQLEKVIEEALSKIPRASAEVFALHYIEGLSHPQIAKKQNVSRQTVRNQISQALKILRKELKNTKNE